MKKIISVILSAALAAASLVSVSATEAPDETSKSYSSVAEYSQKIGNIVVYSYNVPSDSRTKLILKNTKTGNSTTLNWSEIYDAPKSVKAEINAEYEASTFISLGSSGGSSSGKSFTARKSYNYERIKIKLSDYSSYFNKDGSHTATHFGNTHNYTFREEAALSDGSIYSSSLIFVSGAAITNVVPNKNGEAEIVVCKGVGVPTYFCTDFVYRTGASSGGGGGTSGTKLPGVAIGDTDLNGNVDITDATYIQRKIANMQSFDKMQTRNGDLNGDGKIDVTDATYVQMYIANVI